MSAHAEEPQDDRDEAPDDGSVVASEESAQWGDAKMRARRLRRAIGDADRHDSSPDAQRGCANVAFERFGETEHFSIFYERGGGDDARRVAERVTRNCESDFAAISAHYGARNPLFQGERFTFLLVGDNAGGANHVGCGGTRFCTHAYYSDEDFASFLVVAEIADVFNARLSNSPAYYCGSSTGEGLARVLASERYRAIGDVFANAASWLAYREDWVNQNDGEEGDGNFIAIGCSSLFIFCAAAGGRGAVERARPGTTAVARNGVALQSFRAEVMVSNTRNTGAGGAEV